MINCVQFDEHLGGEERHSSLNLKTMWIKHRVPYVGCLIKILI
jgi:hypothetical protein